MVKFLMMLRMNRETMGMSYGAHFRRFLKNMAVVHTRKIVIIGIEIMMASCSYEYWSIFEGNLQQEKIVSERYSFRYFSSH